MDINKLLGAMNVNKGKSFKMNYEDLKNALGYEDYFYNNVIEPTAKEYDFDISFDDIFVVFKKK